MFSVRSQQPDVQISSGRIPPAIGQCSRLSSFAASQNLLQGLYCRLFWPRCGVRRSASPTLSPGPLPTQIGRLTSCTMFLLNDNRLTGLCQHNTIYLPPSSILCFNLRTFVQVQWFQSLRKWHICNTSCWKIIV